MKTILTAIIVAVFVVFPSFCFASYVSDYSGSEVQGSRFKVGE